MDSNGSQMAAKKRCPQCGREYLESFLYCKEDGSELEVIVPELEKKPIEQSGETVVSAASVPPIGVSGTGLPASRFMAALPEPDEIVGSQEAVASAPISRGGVLGMVLTAVLVLAVGAFFVVKSLKPDPKTASRNAKIVGQNGNKTDLDKPTKSDEAAPKPANTSPESAPPKSENSPSALPKQGSKTFVGERFPQTRERLLSASDVASWDFASVRYAINEIYARHGYAFQNPDIRRRFQTFSWYQSKPNLSMEELEKSHLSRIERANSQLLAERRHLLEGHGE